MAAEWPVTSLAQICAEVRYGFTAKATDSDTGVRFLRGTDISGKDYIDWTSVPFCEIGAADAQKYSLVDGDIVIVRMGTIGETALVRNPPRSVCASYLIRHRIDPSVAVPQFIHYVLRSRLFKAFIESHGGGTVQPNINAAVLGTFALPLPPLTAQRQIAAILGTLDDKIETNRNLLRTLDGIASTVFSSWFVVFDPVRRKSAGQPAGLPPDLAALFPDRLVGSPVGEVPEGWTVGTLGQVCEKPQYGLTASAVSDAVGPKFLRITDINKEPWIDWSGVPYCEVSKGEEAAKYRLRAGDLVIARMADPGHAALIEEDRDAVFASYLIRFRPREVSAARYLQYWTRSTGYWDLVHGRKTGSTRSTLNATELSELPIVLPAAPVLRRFASLVDTVRARGVHAIEQSSALAALRDTLLPRLLSGEVTVAEAEDLMRRSEA